MGSEDQDCPGEQKGVTTFSASVSSSPASLGQREEADLGLVGAGVRAWAQLAGCPGTQPSLFLSPSAFI